MEHQVSIAFDGIDTDTPPDEKLTAKYTKSFAYYTVKNRLPVILTKVINDLVISKKTILQKYGEAAEEDLKTVIGKISKLKNELITNKSIIKLRSDGKDIEKWNNYLVKISKSKGYTPCWYYSPWLYVECYMYRRLWEAFENSQILQALDPFAIPKEEALNGSLCQIKVISKIFTSAQYGSLKQNLQDQFIEYMKLCLWSNRCDLSLLNSNQSSDGFLLNDLKTLNSFLLSDDSLKVYEYLKEHPDAIIDFVNDNASYELFCDFCFCDFLCTTSLVSKVRFHVKTFPWFVSDTTPYDINYLLDTMGEEGLELSTRWKKYFETGLWCVYDEKYWTLPFDFNDMKTADLDLYNKLAESNLVILKGDLNYRKLLSDINWDPCEKFHIVLRDFKPTSILSLRTVKSDLICGLTPEKSKELSLQNKTWMTTGNYATIQFYCHN